MKIFAYRTFRQNYQSLPKAIQRKVDKQIRLLAADLRHPSLQLKKIQGSPGLWEIRIDIHYRASLEVQGDSIYLRVVGNHDEVLKNP